MNSSCYHVTAQADHDAGVARPNHVVLRQRYGSRDQPLDPCLRGRLVIFVHAPDLGGWHTLSPVPVRPDGHGHAGRLDVPRLLDHPLRRLGLHGGQLIDFPADMLRADMFPPEPPHLGFQHGDLGFGSSERIDHHRLCRQAARPSSLQRRLERSGFNAKGFSDCRHRHASSLAVLVSLQPHNQVGVSQMVTHGPVLHGARLMRYRRSFSGRIATHSLLFLRCATTGILPPASRVACAIQS